MDIIKLLEVAGPYGFPTLAAVVLWVKANRLEERLAEQASLYTELVREVVKHVERSSSVLERFDVRNK